MNKSDIDWLRKKGFRKTNNAPQWFALLRDSRREARGRCPYFEIEVVFSQTHGWNCRVASSKIVQAIWLECASEDQRRNAGIPGHWRELPTIDLGYCDGSETARDAVIGAVGSAFLNIRNITDKDVYNIENLNRELGQ